MAHALVAMLRSLAAFGTNVLKNRECRELKFAIAEMKFPRVVSRKDRLTAEQVTAIIEKAHDLQRPSIALAQALQFYCVLRQRDVIGEWIPRDEPGQEVVLDGEMKWLRGLLWEEIGNDQVLRHPPSNGGKISVDVLLSEVPAVLDELAKVWPGKRNGPVVVSEDTGLPYAGHDFRRLWREIATAAGVPENVFNMDRRADASDETRETRANIKRRNSKRRRRTFSTSTATLNSRGRGPISGTYRMLERDNEFRPRVCRPVA